MPEAGPLSRDKGLPSLVDLVEPDRSAVGQPIRGVEICLQTPSVPLRTSEVGAPVGHVPLGPPVTPTSVLRTIRTQRGIASRPATGDRAISVEIAGRPTAPAVVAAPPELGRRINTIGVLTTDLKVQPIAHRYADVRRDGVAHVIVPEHDSFLVGPRYGERVPDQVSPAPNGHVVALHCAILERIQEALLPRMIGEIEAEQLVLARTRQGRGGASLTRIGRPRGSVVALPIGPVVGPELR